MELDSSSEDGADDVPISPQDYICQKLIEHGIPDEYVNQLQPGLVSYVQENRLLLCEVVAAICDAIFITSDTRVTIDENLFNVSLAWLQWLMFEDDPQSALRILSENEDGRRAVCGAVWGSNDLAYRCQTCEHDPTCAICVPCFQHGNHEGHDYSIMYTGGGCCDCGDATAWKLEGFCSRHAGWEEIHLPSQEIVSSTGPVLDVLFSYWKDMLMAVEVGEVIPTDGGSNDVQENAGANPLSCAILMMLIYFCTYSEGLLFLISKRMLHSVDLLPLLVRAEKFLDEDVVKKLHELLLKLIAEPLFKYEFAKIYIQYYPNVIQEAVRNCKDSSIENYPLISIFSVQLFTVPTLTPRLVREMNLLGAFLKCMENLLTSCIGEDKRLQASKWYNLYETSSRVIQDICFSLSHNEVPQYVVLAQKDVFKRWLNLLGLVQGMDPQKRVTAGSHIEQENLNLHKTFALGHYLGNVNDLLVEGALSVGGIISDRLFSDLGTEMLDGSDLPRYLKVGRLSELNSSCHISLASKSKGRQSVGSQFILPTVAWLISECFGVIEKFLEPLISQANVVSLHTTSIAGCNLSSLTKKLFERKCSKKSATKSSINVQFYDASSDIGRMSKGRQSGEDHYFQAKEDIEVINWPRISYDVSLQEISFHIPLHRFLSLLLHKAMELCYNENETFQSHADFRHASSSHIFFRKVLGNYHPYGFSSFLMEHPLQLRVFCAQVHAGMWTRNGNAGIHISEWYYGVYWFHISLEVDLFLLQCSAAMAPPDLFLTRILERFGLSDYLSLNPATDNENEVVLMKEMLTLIIEIVKERRFCGLSPTENLQRELVHRLALGDATRSQLVKALPRDLAKSKSLQEVIDIVAVYMKPSSMKQGKYSLRRAYWKDLDLYFPRWKSRDLQVAEERFLHICKVSPLCIQLPRWSKIYDPLSTLSRIATSKTILQIVRSVLFYAASTEMPSLCRAPDGVLISALHLLSLALDVCEKQKDVYVSKFNNSTYTLNDTGESYVAASFPTEIIPMLEFATEPTCAEVGNESGISRQQSLISLLVLLMNKHKKENNDADLRLRSITFLIGDLLKKFSQLDDVCMKELKRLGPDLVFEMPEDSSRNSTLKIRPSSESETRKLKAREQQAAILAKMKAEQSKFAASFKNTENDNLEVANSNLGQELEKSDPVCSLCRDTHSKSSLSFLVLLQKSRLSSFVKRGPSTWKENGMLSDKPSILSEGITGMAIDASNSLNASQTENTHYLYRPEGDAFMVTAVDQLQVKTTSYSSNNIEKDIPPSIEMVEKAIYLSVEEETNLLKLQSGMLVDDQMYVPFLGTESLKSGNNKESSSVEDCIAQFSVEALKNHTPTEGLRHVEDASPISTTSFLTDCDGIHISSCGHAMHLECHDRYMSSLRQRYSGRFGFEGGHIFYPELGELLCPVCRRFINSILPAFSKDPAASRRWNLGTSVDSHSTSDAGILSLSDPNNNVSQIRNAVSLLWSMAKTVKQARYSPTSILKVFPRKMSEAVKPNLLPVLQKLSNLYFLHEHGKATISRTSHSMMLWDTLEYSLISAEIATRGRGDTGSGDLFLTRQALEGEIRSSNGAVLAELLQFAHLCRSFDGVNLLVRFRGCQFFADSTCAGVLGEFDIPHFDWKQDSLSSILLEERSLSIKFWKFAADPILSHEPFSSLMWILFSLPAPFMLSMETFDSLVHLFYVVGVVQALITCQGMCCYDRSSFNNSLLYDICKILGDSDLARQYFVSNHADNSCSPNDMIRKFTFPYLRRCALLKELLKSSPSTSFLNPSEESTLSSRAKNQADARGVSELETMFQICQLDVIFNDEFVQRLALKWCEHFLRAFAGHKPGNVLHMTTAVPFRPVQLPHLYQELLERYIKQQCPNCRDVLENPALCLLCGRLCSYGHKQCCRANSCKTHTVACGAGIGVFLLVRRTTILLQRSGRHAIWPSLYLDAFGEEDHDMSRGRPLYLSEERYLDLTNLVASHGLDHSSEVLRRTIGGYTEFD